MNRTSLHIIFVAGFALVAASCSSSGTTPNPGGSISGGNTTSSSSGGNTSQGSTVNSGGSSQPGDTGGASNADTGGSGDTGGSAGGKTSVASATSEGGTTSAASTTAAGGVTKTGGTTGPAGSTAAGGVTKTGGTTGAAGSTAAGGSTKTGGTTGAAGSTSAGGAPSSGGTPGAGGGASVLPETVVPDLMGFYWEGTCNGNIVIHGRNCPYAPKGSTSATCPSGATWDTRGTIISQVLNVKGTTGTEYTVTIQVAGVLGTRCYTGGTPAVANMTPSATGPNNTWYVGGVQANNSIWNTYELHIAPPVADAAANVYYFNAFPSNPDWCQKEASYQIGYTASFKVLGGGTMTFTVHDANCMVQQNCGGDDTATTCSAPRTIDLSGMTPPATFTQPPKNSVNGTTYYPQWLYFDVKSVTSP